MNPSRFPLPACLAAGIASLTLTFGTDQASAAVVFDEDFESPVITPVSGGNTNGTLPDNGNWVGATQGFGANRRGITNKGGGDFSAAAGNDQAFAFRYTNSGLTTAEGVIGTLTLDSIINISFDVVKDSGAGATGLPYKIELVAFPPGAARNDVRPSFSNYTLLASTDGDAGGDGLFDKIMLPFTPDVGLHAADVGKDLAIRFIGATDSAIVDNVVVNIDVIPEPSRATLIALGAALLIARRRR